MQFIDRRNAGKKLAHALVGYRDRRDAIVLALPRGGVPVAYEVAQALNLPLDLMLVRKLGVPGHEELAMGAIANGNVQILNEDIVKTLGISDAAIKEVAAEEHEELLRRNEAYRNGRAAPELKGLTVILVDDGMATGANMRAAVMAARKQHAAHIIVAVPVSSDAACNSIEKIADEVISLQTPSPFYGVGQWYLDFSQTSDVEVQSLMKQLEPKKKRGAKS
jgi:predicted phosphoribosyltransferase